MDTVKRFLGCADKGCTGAQLAAASPATYVKAGDLPMLLIVGSADNFVGPTAGRTRAASLEALQRIFEFIERTVGQHSSAAAR